MAKWYDDNGIRKVRYVIVNECALGYIYEEDPTTIGLLRGMISRGYPYLSQDPMSTFGNVIRDVTLEDFEIYRVMVPKFIIEQY
ncbi:hypothetical protein 65p417 [Aeromonas phage 65]|uniref:Uncharacterized protein n=2 Tax=Ishigurovirus osborne TaxID=260149 RepID=A0A219YCP1_9CAUD|nr:hypothetical protein ST65p417 [Aeromonas phage 65]ADQ53424.1 hypothetical protein 65p417 [Aeromonas phage 65]APU01781.1 hypothetical protein [Aeromonas phage 65.2]